MPITRCSPRAHTFTTAFQPDWWRDLAVVEKMLLVGWAGDGLPICSAYGRSDTEDS
jgi:hypothetical protein